MTTRHHLLLGTIAKACLTPGGTGDNISSQLFNTRPTRPRKILFQSQRDVAMLSPDLHDLGIDDIAVAELPLRRSIELYESEQNDARNEIGFDPLAGPQALGMTLIQQAELSRNPYVDEPDEPYDLGSWSPPRERGKFPARWFARPPDDTDSYRPTSLLGWRTNLERAILREDATKVKEIVAKRDATMIREYVECRMLLTKCAMRGLLEACKLLIEDCNASVEGAQAPDSKSWWNDIQNRSGNIDDLTPLQHASRNGQLESMKLLLDYGADVNRIDKASIRGSALHHAISQGQIECCRLLIERGADLTYGM